MELDYLFAAFQDAGVVELRHESNGRWRCGQFDNIHALVGEVESRRGDGNLYISLNRPYPRCVANAMTSRALRDLDIERIVRIPLDFDAVRPTGQPSSESELRAALKARDEVVSYLTSFGWPPPALGVSGNGAHAVYRTDMEACLSVANALEQLYGSLAARFGRPDVKFDVVVSNPSRVLRLYGTYNRKGTPRGDRIHRMSSIELPRPWWVVATGLVLHTATAHALPATSPPESAGRLLDGLRLGDGDYSTLDAVAWFASHGSYVRRLRGTKHAVKCPWAHEHSAPSPVDFSDTVIWTQEGGRWPSFHCSHAHCAGKRIVDVMSLWGDADQYCRAAWRVSALNGLAVL